MTANFMFFLRNSLSLALLLSLGVSNSIAGPIDVSLNFSNPSFSAGSDVTVTVHLNSTVSFNTLDATLKWDPAYLQPYDQVTTDPFGSLGGVFTGTSFFPASFNSNPGDSFIVISAFATSPPSQQASGPGDLFSLTFRALVGGSATANLVQFDSLGADPGDLLYGVGLALNLIYDPNGDVSTSPQQYTYNLPTVTISEPATAWLWLAGCMALARWRKISAL